MAGLVGLGIWLGSVERSSRIPVTLSPSGTVPLPVDGTAATLASQKTYVNKEDRYKFQYSKMVQITPRHETTGLSEVQVGYLHKGSNSVLGIRTYKTAEGVYHASNAQSLGEFIQAWVTSNDVREYHHTRLAGADSYEISALVPVHDAPPERAVIIFSEAGGKLYELFFPIGRGADTRPPPWRLLLDPMQREILSSFHFLSPSE